MNTRLSFDTIAHTITDCISLNLWQEDFDRNSAEKSFKSMLLFSELAIVLETIYHYSRKDKKFLIIIDPHRADVSELMLDNSCKETVSIVDYAIYVAGQLDADAQINREKLQGNILYGMTLFLLDKIFPKQDNHQESADFASITSSIWLDKSAYPATCQLPLLMEKYQRLFLPACKTYQLELKNNLKSYACNPSIMYAVSIDGNLEPSKDIVENVVQRNSFSG